MFLTITGIILGGIFTALIFAMLYGSKQREKEYEKMRDNNTLRTNYFCIKEI